MTEIATAPDDMNEATMQCMEVWGGNDFVDTQIAMAGLDAWIVSRPLKGAPQGGDVHYLSSCATGRVARMLLADVSGHGEAVSKISTALRHLMRKFVNFIDQTHFVAGLNSSFHQLDVEGNFATALVMSWFGPTRELSLTNAGHPSPLIYVHDEDQWRYLENEEEERPPGSIPRDVPLGVVDDVIYSELRCQLHPMDLILCYSDALVETMGQGSARKGQEFLLSWLAQADAENPQELIAKLTREVEAMTDDDLTIMVFRPRNDRPWEGLRNKLLAPAHMMCGLISALRHRDRPIPWPEVSIANLGGALIGALNRFRSKPK